MFEMFKMFDPSTTLRDRSHLLIFRQSLFPSEINLPAFFCKLPRTALYSSFPTRGAAPSSLYPGLQICRPEPAGLDLRWFYMVVRKFGLCNCQFSHFHISQFSHYFHPLALIRNRSLFSFSQNPALLSPFPSLRHLSHPSRPSRPSLSVISVLLKMALPQSQSPESPPEYWEQARRHMF